MELESKKVLVTGADGFIGSHLVEALLSNNIDVRAMVYYNSLSKWGWLDALSEKDKGRVEIVLGDVRDAYLTRTAVEGVDVIFHLAALIAIPFSYIAPQSYLETNVMGTLNLLQAAKDYGVKRFLHTSTSEVYGTAQEIPITEKHVLQAQSPYSASKIGADKLVESFWRAFDFPITIVRPFNTYGPRQSARAVIPTIISQLLCEKEKIKLGSLHPERDFVYVKDTVQGMIEIAKSDNALGEEINIATGKAVSIRSLADMIMRKVDNQCIIEEDSNRVRPLNSEVDCLIGSNEKLIGLTGWEPTKDISQGLDETIFWFKKENNISQTKSNVYQL